MLIIDYMELASIKAFSLVGMFQNENIAKTVITSNDQSKQYETN